ncbi:MAG TPA: hypothetical protein VK780_00190 [Thermoanaerobaculia bacterium]|nr:hypothetical protein [Thermoanaerobaculia bacterium]
MTGPGWRESIRRWLDANRGIAPPGLPVEEARARAEELARILAQGQKLPKSFGLDDSGKDVLYALVEFLEGPRFPPKERAEAAERVAEFLRGLAWPFDALGEREQLIRACDSLSPSAAVPPGAYPLPQSQAYMIADAPMSESDPSAHLDDAAMSRFVNKEMTPEEKERAVCHLDACEVCSASVAAIAAFGIRPEDSTESGG